MALDPKIVKMLNDFADSQPALRLETHHWGTSNPQLGTVLDEAIDAASGGGGGGSPEATDVTYTPTAAGDWNSPPAEVAAGLDELAARIEASEGITSDIEGQAYTAGTPGDWDGTAPATIKEAIDRMATAVAGLLTNPIP